MELRTRHSAQHQRSECQLDLEEWEAARRTTEGILAASDVTPRNAASAHFNHGKALWHLGRRAVGIAEVRAVRDDLAKRNDKRRGFLALVEKWPALTALVADARGISLAIFDRGLQRRRMC